MQTKTIFLLFLINLLLSACQSVAPTSGVNTAIPLHENAVIFTREYAEGANISALYNVENFNTPDSDDVMALENKLPAYLRENANQFSDAPYPWDSFDKYQRQYVSYEENGKEMIYGNFFCDSSDLDWTVNFIEIEDGGECYFQIRYDVESGTFTELRVNGES